MKKRFTFLIAAIAAILMMAQPKMMVGQSKDLVQIVSFSRSNGTDTYTSGQTLTKAIETKNGIYQDGSNNPAYLQLKGSSAYWTTTPTSISFTANLGGGSTKDPLDNNVYVVLIDSNGNEISSTVTTVTTKITSTTGSNFTVSVPVANNVYGVKIRHAKDTGYNVRYYSFSLSYEAGGGGSAVATPQISGNTPFLNSTTVSISCDTDGASIQYSLDNGTNWSNYSKEFTLTETKTVKAKATKSGMTDSQVATEIFTKVTPITVSAALTAISELENNGTIANQCVSGIVCTAGSLSSGAITYNISADGTTSNRLQVYKGKGLYNANFTNASDIAVGDEVVVYGTLKKYVSGNTTTPEFDQGSYLLSKVRRPAISTSVTELTGFTYVEGHGPSTTQTVSVSGSNLTANISLSLGDNSNFEMCLTQNGTYTNSLTLNQSNGSVPATNVYVRLKSGLSKANNYAGTITLTSTDATNKTVSLSGSVTGQTYAIEQYSLPATAHGTITFSPESPIEDGTEVTLTAEPAEGYDFTANSWVFYKESGNDIVEDNSITVTNGKITMPAYDLWVDATFAPKPTFDVTCAYDNTQGSLQADPTSAYEGQTVTLTYSESTNYELDAITLTHTDGGAVAQGVTLTKGEGNTYTFNMPGYAVTATATFVYTIFEGTFEPYTGDIVEGDYIIYGGTNGAMKNVISSNRFANSGEGDISISSNTITDPKKTVVWHIAKIGNTNYWSIYNARVGKYAGGTDYKNQGALLENVTDLAKWTITYNSGYTFENYGRTQASSDNTNAYLRQNGSNGWATYASGTGNAPTLYKLAVATAPEWSTLPTPSILTNANYQLNLNELVSGTPVPTITVSTSATGYTLENGAFAFSTATAGTYEFTFRASNTAGYADATLTITVSAPQTFNLTVSTLNDNVNGINVYNTNDENTPLIAGGAAGTVQVTEGTEIKVRPNVAAGYVLESLTINTTDVISEIDETGAYTFTMTGNVTISATAEFNPVVELTSTNISNMENAGSGYATLKYITVGGYYWEAKAYNTSNEKNYLQINTPGDGNAAGSYIKLPVFNGKIESIVCTVNSNNKYLYFNTTNSKPNNPIATGGDGSASTTKTIDMSEVFYQTGYIVSSGSIQITNITVTYSPYSDMTGTSLPTTIAADQTIAVPTNTDATATDLTIPASSGVIIKSGAKLTVSGTLTNNGTANNIVIEDGGQLKFTSTGAKDGGVQATVQKNITKWDEGSTGGWYFIASPITGSISPASVTNLLGEQIQTTPSVLYNYDLYRFNPSEPDNKGWENYHQHNAELTPFMLENGQGYLFAKSSTTTLEFAGAIKPYDADNTIEIAVGWNLIGNPYTFNAYPNHAYYTINDANTGITANTETSNAAVAPCTGIIVKATSEGTVKFLDGPAASANNGNLQMVLSQTVATRGENNTVTLDNAIVSFNEGSELEKFYFGNQDANIYIPQNNEQYAIVSSEARGEMPVCFKANRDGQFTINVNAENVEMSYLHLIDNIAGQDIDLIATPSYTFDAKGDDYESRFRLVFSANNENENQNENDDFAFVSNGEIIVNGTGTIQIIDMMGRVISTKSTEERISTNGMTPGVYVLRLIGNDTKTQKIVVK